MQTITVRLTNSEKSDLESAAVLDDRTLSQHVRRRLDLPAIIPTEMKPTPIRSDG